MNQPIPAQALPNLTPMEREFLLRQDALRLAFHTKMAAQDSKIEALEVQVRGQEAAITRLTDLLTSWLGPVVPKSS